MYFNPTILILEIPHDRTNPRRRSFATHENAGGGASQACISLNNSPIPIRVSKKLLFNLYVNVRNKYN